MFNENRNYTVLVVHGAHDPRLVWKIDKKIAIIMSILMFPVTLFCISYTLVFGIYPNVIYPKLVIRDVPEQIIHRALLYNTNQNTTQFSNIEMHPQKIQTIDKFRIVCYYNFPNRPTSLQVEDINASLCTHINVAFAGVLNNTVHLEASRIEVLKKLVSLKDANKNLKILISVGGAGNTNGYGKMVLNHANRKSFIKSVLSYVNEYKIDGVDLDWEFPNEQNNGDKMQKLHFTQLLEEFRKCINRQETHKFLVTVAVPAPTVIIDNSYDVSYMNDYVDFVNVMTYDYHYYSKTTPFTGINSPLYGADDEKSYLSTLNINYTVHYWNFKGMDRHKITIGLPTYGHTFRLINSLNNGTYAPASGYGRLGFNGFTDYAPVCQFLSANHISPIFQMDTRSPYASKMQEWLSFDNPQSLTYKAEYIRNNNFGGAMVYSLNADDYQGLCKSGKFPLIESIYKVLGGRDV